LRSQRGVGKLLRQRRGLRWEASGLTTGGGPRRIRSRRASGGGLNRGAARGACASTRRWQGRTGATNAWRTRRPTAADTRRGWRCGRWTGRSCGRRTGTS